MKRLLLGLTLAAGLSSACASSPAQIRAGLDPWVGQPVSALIGRWGPPQGTFPLPDAGAVYTWLYASQPVTTTNAYYYPAIHSGTANTFTEQSFCRFDWTITPSGYIAGYRWAGSCKVTR